MPAPLTKRQPVKIIALYIEQSADLVRRINAWALDPRKLEFSNDMQHYSSKDVIVDVPSMKIAFDKTANFIKYVNDASNNSTLPDLIIWDDKQFNILEQHISNIRTLVRHITFLRDRCYDIFKHNLSLQGFSLDEISDIMGIEGEDGVKMAIIARDTEREFKKIARTLKTNSKKNKLTD